jgi:alkyldihydroxyacetonephosphate synthase
VASSHQSHAYADGACLYFTFAGRPADSDAGADADFEAGGSGSDDPGLARWVERYYRQAWDRVTEATMDAGGAISHHHGIGINRSRFLPAALGGGMGVLASVKRALDPNGILNPGKLGLDSPFGPVPWP